MNVNVKLSFDDDQRRRIASAITGKPVKRLATRAEINQLVMDLLVAGALSPAATAAPKVRAGQTVRTAGPVEFNQIPDREDFCSDECCRQNELLLSRLNVLQHRLDTL